MNLQLNRPAPQMHRSVSFPPAISTAPTAIVSQRRRLLVKGAVLLFLFLLIEGIIRKWVFPGYHDYFYFLRDPLLIGFLLMAVVLGALEVKGWLALWLAVAFFVSLLSLLVYMFYELPPTLYLLGLRAYFMYLPLAFVVARTFERDDIAWLAKLVAVCAVPMAFICVRQFYSPRGDWLNVGAGGAPPAYFADGLLRTTGFLASDAQHGMYLVFSLSLLAAVLIGARLPRKDRYILIAGCIATLTMMVVSGSRAIWFQAAVIGLAAVASFLLMGPAKRGRLRRIMVPLSAILVVAVLFSTLLGEAYRGYEERNIDAGTFSVKTINRIIGMVLPSSMFEASISGKGIGVGTTGASALIQGERGFTLAEGDLDRNFLELGLFAGWIFVGLRVMFAAWLVWISLRAARRGDAMALLLAAFAAPVVFQHQITMHVTYGHLAWFATGLTMAAARSALVPVGGRGQNDVPRPRKWSVRPRQLTAGSVAAPPR